MRLQLIGVLMVVAACGSTTYQEGDPYMVPAVNDAGGDAGVVADAGKRDAGALPADAGARDGGVRDAGSMPVDAGVRDAGLACSVTNCAGCCTATGQCKGGQASEACGKHGMACDLCSEFERCGGGQSCEIDPTTTWLVRPTAAAVKHQAWDDSPPDVELTLWCPATHAMANGFSPKVQDSYDPTWSEGGCTGSTVDLITGGFGFTAVDVDFFADDEVCPFTTLPVTEAALRAGVLQLTSTCGFDSLTVTLTKQ